MMLRLVLLCLCVFTIFELVKSDYGILFSIEARMGTTDVYDKDKVTYNFEVINSAGNSIGNCKTDKHGVVYFESGLLAVQDVRDDGPFANLKIVIDTLRKQNQLTTVRIQKHSVKMNKVVTGSYIRQLNWRIKTRITIPNAAFSDQLLYHDLMRLINPSVKVSYTPIISKVPEVGLTNLQAVIKTYQVSSEELQGRTNTPVEIMESLPRYPKSVYLSFKSGEGLNHLVVKALDGDIKTLYTMLKDLELKFQDFEQ